MNRRSSMFERLENREVFSADPILGSVAAFSADAAVVSTPTTNPALELSSLGRPDDTRQQIIAILIGLAYPPPGTTTHSGNHLVGASHDAALDDIAATIHVNTGVGNDRIDSPFPQATASAPRTR